MSDEEYDFEYEDSDENMDDQEDEIALQNLYYHSKGIAESKPSESISSFKQIVKLENEKGEWGFKALKQCVKLYFKLGKYSEMMESYRELLTFIKSAVTRNAGEKCLTSLLDFVSGTPDKDVLQEFYENTLGGLEETKNERLWFKTNLKLGNLWYERKLFGKLSRVLKELHKSCQNEDGTDDMKKGTRLLEVYALEIQMYTERKNNKKLKALYHRSLKVKSAIPHPKILGIIRECGGKMHCSEKEWGKASTDFFEAYKNYDEAGSGRRLQCLKYLILTHMLTGSDIDPLEATETKAYRNDPQIVAMTNLLNAYQNQDIYEFEKILKTNKKNFMEDSFIRDHIEDLVRILRTKSLHTLLKPYTRIRLSYISQELNTPEAEVEQLLVSLILDGHVNGKIDQVNGVLLLERQQGSEVRKFKSVERWIDQVTSVHQKLGNKL